MSVHLHDDEEDERDEDVDLGVFPGMMVADVVKLLSYTLATPGAVVEQSNQRLVLRQLTNRKSVCQVRVTETNLHCNIHVVPVKISKKRKNSIAFFFN